MSPIQPDTPPTSLATSQTPTAATPISSDLLAQKKRINRLMFFGIGLFFLGGPLALLVGSILNAILGNPADNTSGRAIVNISMAVIGVFSVICYMIIGVVLIVQGSKYSKAKKNAQ